MPNLYRIDRSHLYTGIT